MLKEAVPARKSRLRGAWILLAFFLLALGLRVIGIDSGYFYGDERVAVAGKVLTGQLVPDNHYYPPFYDYLNAVAFGVLFVVGRATSMWQSAGEFRDLYFSDPTLFFLTARFTAALSAALVAPLFYLIGRGLGLGRWGAIVMGLAGVALPNAVLLSHISKSDVPLATAAVFLIYLVFLRQRTERSPWLDLLIGLAVVLGLSFKQTFVFLAAPVLLSHGAVLLFRIPVLAVLAAAARGIAVCLVLWPIFNIGIVLDFEGFLAYQEIQRMMSIRDDGILAAAAVWFEMASSLTRGITVIGVLLFLAFPAVLFLPGMPAAERLVPLLIWASVALAVLGTLSLVGIRQQEGLWIMHFTAMQLFAGLSVALLMGHGRPVLRSSGIGAGAALVLFGLLGSGLVLAQALKAPMKADIVAYLEAEHADARILSIFRLDQPKTEAVYRFEVDRSVRLAAKYGVELPPVAGERGAEIADGEGLHVLQKPFFLWGLENLSDEELEGRVQAYSWPGQPEEWLVPYWTDLGYGIHIVADLDLLLTGRGGPLMQQYLEDVVARCEERKRFAPGKELFLEREVVVFSCPV